MRSETIESRPAASGTAPCWTNPSAREISMTVCVGENNVIQRGSFEKEKRFDKRPHRDYAAVS